MSAPVPSTRRSASGSRRFDYCRFIELDYIPMETGFMVSMRPTDRGYLTTKSPERHCRRTAAPVSNRDPHGNASLSSSSTNSGSCKGSDCSPTKGRHMKAYTSCTDNHGIRPPPPEQYLTPLQQKEVCIRHLRARLKETVDRLQDRDSEIDELRTQLSRMQEDWVEEECHRVETQLALKEARREIQQLKEVVDVVCTNLSSSDSTDTSVQKYFQDINVQNHKLETLLLSMELAQNGVAKEQEAAAAARGAAGWAGAGRPGTAGSWPGSSPATSGTGWGGSKSLCGSCDGSPARSLPHSFTYTKLSDHALADKNGNGLSGEENHDSGFVCCGESHSAASSHSHSRSAANSHSRSAASSHRADLLLEAAFLSEETASLLSTYSHLPHFSNYDKLCPGKDRVAPLRCAMGGAGSHPCLSHHHLYLHHPREQAVQTESCPVPVGVGYASDLDTIAERTFRSQACSPTSTWVSDEGDDLDSVTMTSVTTTTLTATTEAGPGPPLPSSSCLSVDMPSLSVEEDGEAVGELERQTEVVGESAGGMVEAGKQEEVREIDVDSQREDVEVRNQGELEEVWSVEVEEVRSVEEVWSVELEEMRSVEEVWSVELEEMRSVEVVSSVEGEEMRSVEEVRSVELEEVRSVEGEEVRSVELEEVMSVEEVRSVEEQPHTSQPRGSLLQQEEIAGVTVVEVDDDEDQAQGAVGGEEESTSSGSGPAVKSYWSRHFLVDLLAVAVPVVPTVAWLCRGPRGDALPIYHFGSLLRGCCTVALSSLRRAGGVRHYPAGTGGGAMGGTEI
ncbi:syntaphilin-like isoform X3 [Salvelinus fontinalis]|uniref:syntaphilin-like isoform X3 n=1 Tax=Salvelinus fontinalis TaxID=8038 RepID=UPI00248500A7|nr:syntaphilin-like isoform X3 [Salvelinus fontinalis]